jgi:hypothetical protein
MVPAGSGKVRGVLTKFGSDYQLLAVPKRCGDDCLSSVLLQDFQAVVDKTNLSLPGWTNIVQSGKTERTVYSGNGVQYYGQSVIQYRLVDFAKIDMDTHTNEILTFRTATSP